VHTFQGEMYQMSYNTNTNMNATSIAAFIVNLQKENTDLRNKVKTLEDENIELHIQIAEYHIDSDTESVASNDYESETESETDSETDSDFFVSYNSDLTDVFDKLASYEEDPHKRDAYRKAADAIYNLPFKVKSGSELTEGSKKVSGIGKSIAKKIDEFLETGKVAKLEKIEYPNLDLADAFDSLCYYETDEFKKNAYDEAAYAISKLTYKVTSGEELSKGPKKIPGIGKGIAKKIDEFLETGKIKHLEQLKHNAKLKKSTSTNEEIAWALEALASLEAEPHGSQDPFKIRAYRRAAEVIRELNFEVTSGEEIAKGPKKIEGIGAGIGKKIDEFLQTGKIKRIEELSKP
jgi:DNA polymerase/3'-5' exonuclease PolX